ncbi:MAG: class I SAM-dependent methyltransferase, partial [Thermoplasmata archaeon]|nr:class I SAM-dependent methyltransferase [Thermoplasmata archaeon]
ALHWLELPVLQRVYQEVARLLRPGGLFLNGDQLGFGPESPILAGAAHRAHERWTAAGRARLGSEDWDDWWSSLRKEPSLEPLFAERDRRFPSRHGEEPKVPYDQHVEALRSAGFTEVETVWQEFDNRVVLAVR